LTSNRLAINAIDLTFTDDSSTTYGLSLKVDYIHSHFVGNAINFNEFVCDLERVVIPLLVNLHIRRFQEREIDLVVDVAMGAKQIFLQIYLVDFDLYFADVLELHLQYYRIIYGIRLFVALFQLYFSFVL
jgi:hypothetical protein